MTSVDQAVVPDPRHINSPQKEVDGMIAFKGDV